MAWRSSRLALSKVSGAKKNRREANRCPDADAPNTACEASSTQPKGFPRSPTNSPPDAVVFQGTDNVNDTLSLDLGSLPRLDDGTLTTKTIVYNGGAGGYDTLKLSGGSFQSVTYVPTGRDSGILAYDDLTIIFTGLEPVIDTTSAGAIYIYGTDNADNIYAVNGGQDANGDDMIRVYEANANFEEVSFANKQAAFIFAGGGDDTVHLNYTTLATGLNQMHVYGGDGNDTLYGSNFNDWLNGDNGNDVMYGKSGDDVLVGGDGSDTLYGGDGNDDLVGDGYDWANFAETGNDTLEGDAGDDVYYYASDNGGNSLVTDFGSDTIVESNNTDEDMLNFGGVGVGITIDLSNTTSEQTVIPDVLNITLSGPDGIRYVLGTNSADTITGNSRDNIIYAYGGDDTVHGGDGNDILLGGDGSDRLYGDAGNDFLDADGADWSGVPETGNDTLSGGTGSDAYIYMYATSSGYSSTTDFGNDTIVEADNADGDVLAFSNFPTGVNVDLSSTGQQIVTTWSANPYTFIVNGHRNCVWHELRRHDHRQQSRQSALGLCRR